MNILVTGAGGLIGSETSRFFLNKGATVIGIDNNKRKYFFGEMGDISGNLNNLVSFDRFHNIEIDITDKVALFKVFKNFGPFDLIVHTAAQPSHDWAKKDPITDFKVNAFGTLNLLEAFRVNSPNGSFIFTSTNKVYGDLPNTLPLTENEFFFVPPKL